MLWPPGAAALHVVLERRRISASASRGDAEQGQSYDQAQAYRHEQDRHAI
jgi:hypothetical protein